ncbi:hypothetical protein FRB96_009609 [Tulasnella sp. 330]|nr:hypothetical protein FRB96_009609 [Tulasnella sp. 330]
MATSDLGLIGSRHYSEVHPLPPPDAETAVQTLNDTDASCLLTDEPVRTQFSLWSLRATRSHVRRHLADDPSMIFRGTQLLSQLSTMTNAKADTSNNNNQASSSSTHFHLGGGGTDGSDSAGSSYPASPATRFLDHDSSPPTTPSQTSSSEELSKTFVPQANTTIGALPRNLLQERIAMNLRLQTNSPRPSSHTRSSSYSIGGASSDAASPVTPDSIRSSKSSVRSTASSIFERVCGGSKSRPATTELFSDHKSSMGVFTPVSAKTAAGSLRHLTVGRQRTLSSLAFQYPLSSESEEVEDAQSSTVPRHRHQRLPTHRTRTRNSLAPPPTVCLTASSFQAPSPLDSEHSHPTDLHLADPSPFSPSTSATTATPKTFSRQHPAIPSSWLNNNATPKINSASSSSPSPPNQRLITSNTNNLRPHKKSNSMPALDPTLAALEKSCRLKSKVECVACGTTGYDFPKDRSGRAICSRECRMALKAAANATVAGTAVKQEVQATILRI